MSSMLIHDIQGVLVLKEPVGVKHLPDQAVHLSGLLGQHLVLLKQTQLFSHSSGYGTGRCCFRHSA